MKKFHLFASLRPALFFALVLSIPAFYLILAGPTAQIRRLGNLLYGLIAILIAIDMAAQKQQVRSESVRRTDNVNGAILFFGAVASAWPTELPWAVGEWIMRLGFCSVVFIRLSQLLARWIAPHHLFQILGIAVLLLAIAGGGFYWLEPQVLTYADGLWLAFTTGATVGYGDLVPSTPASRIFAIFIVLLGYAVFSVVTASIAALFVGEEERKFEKELHADIKSLRNEIANLREELRLSFIDRKT